MTDVSADQGSSGGGWRMFDFRKPIDFNTIIIVLSFVAGGFYFVAATRADLAATQAQVKDMREEIFTLTQRIDSLFSRPVGKGG